MKKRIVVFMMVLAMTVLALTGCGSGKSASPVVGTWTATVIEMSGVTVKIDEYLEQIGIDDMKNEMELKADGKLSVDLMGQQGEGTWKYEAPTVTLSIDGDDATAEYKDGKLVMDLGGIYMTFEK